MTQEALKLALDALETELSIDWTNNDEFNASAEKMHEAITAIKEALAQPKQEPVAWRTFDGEGGYDYRSYEDNESYADDWNKRNPNHAGWVDKLYTHSQPEQEPVGYWKEHAQGMQRDYDLLLADFQAQRTWVGLTDEEIEYVWRRVETSDFHDCVILFAKELEAKLKDKNCVG